MSKDGASFGECATIIKYDEKRSDNSMNSENTKWTSKIRLEKYNNDESLKSGIPDEVMNIEGNTALMNGLNLLWKMANGQTEGIYYLNASNTHVGVGNSSAAAQSSQTGLLGTTKFYAPMDNSTMTYPVINTNTMTVRAKFGPSDANFIWNEWGVLNGNPDNLGGRPAESVIQFNRKVEPMGTKVEGSTWIIVADLIINP